MIHARQDSATQTVRPRLFVLDLVGELSRSWVASPEMNVGRMTLAAATPYCGTIVARAAGETS